jgi:hypothetical protein
MNHQTKCVGLPSLLRSGSLHLESHVARVLQQQNLQVSPFILKESTERVAGLVHERLLLSLAGRAQLESCQRHGTLHHSSGLLHRT